MFSGGKAVGRTCIEVTQNHQWSMLMQFANPFKPGEEHTSCIPPFCVLAHPLWNEFFHFRSCELFKCPKLQKRNWMTWPKLAPVDFPTAVAGYLNRKIKNWQYEQGVKTCCCPTNEKLFDFTEIFDIQQFCTCVVRHVLSRPNKFYTRWGGTKVDHSQELEICHQDCIYVHMWCCTPLPDVARCCMRQFLWPGHLKEEKNVDTECRPDSACNTLWMCANSKF